MIAVLLFLSTFIVLFAASVAIIFGYQKYIGLLYFAFIQLFYLLYAPWVNYLNNDYSAFNTNLSEYDFIVGSFLLLVHLSFFYIGYFTSHLLKKYKIYQLTDEVYFKENKKKAIFVYVFIFLLIAINSAFGEINLYDILLGKNEGETLGFKGGSNWISSMADSLIILMVISQYYKAPILFKSIFYPITLFLFLILGFRYRLLLVIFGFIFLYLKKNVLTSNQVFKIFLFLFITFYAFMFFSENRISFYSGKYDNLKYDITDFNFQSIHHNALGSIVDFAMYKSLREEKSQYDFGESMFVYPLIMVAPSSFFKNSEKPYPAPQINTIDRSLNVPRSYGQACTFVGMSYNAFSWLGVIVFSIIFGFCASKLEFYHSKEFVFFVKIAILLACFQLYTRGYLGLFLLPLLFMILPIILIKYNILFKKNAK